MSASPTPPSREGITGTVAAMLERSRRVVLAVSGGIDSMTLLDSVARVCDASHHVVVATFDHGTGPHATEGAALAAREGALRGFGVRAGRATDGLRSEAAWREARWRFLRRVADAERSHVVTAHTRDDHVETVVMRILRGTGARGLAALAAASDVLRPLLRHGRGDVVTYARAWQVPFVDDPSNLSRAHLRNRVRLDLMPALREVDPGFELTMLDLATRAATIRSALDDVARKIAGEMAERDELEVPLDALAGLDEDASRLLWQGLAGLLGVTLDRRGLVRLGAFAANGRTGQRIQLSGGHEVVRSREHLVLRLGAPEPVPDAGARLGDKPVHFGAWHFRPLRRTTIRSEPDSPWTASLPRGGDLVVRAWRPGDRMVMDARGTLRRVKRFFADAGIAGPQRAGWPVVLAAGQIVWIPGIRRSQLALSRTDSSSHLSL